MFVLHETQSFLCFLESPKAFCSLIEVQDTLWSADVLHE